MSEAKAPAVTVADLDRLLEAHLKLEAEKEALEAQLTAKNKEIAVSTGKIAAYLKELGRKDYSSPIAVAQHKVKWRVSLPQTDKDKALFFAHLRERGLFDQMATVNANSLNALYFRDEAEAIKRGDLGFSMPGIGPAKDFATCEIKPRKK